MKRISWRMATVAGMASVLLSGRQPPAGAAPVPVGQAERWPADDTPLPEGVVARLGSGRFRHGASVWAVAFSPDGKLLASAGQGPGVRLWDVRTGKEVRSFGGFSGNVWSVAFSPDGGTLAAPDSSEGWSVVRLLSVATGEERRLKGGRAAGPGAGGLAAAVFSPDGKLLAGSDEAGALRLWEVATGKEVGELSGHTHPNIPRLAFSPDGKILASSGQDGTVRLWDVAGRKALHVLRPEDDGIFPVVFSRDGKCLLTGGQRGATPDPEKARGTLCVWDTATGKPQSTVPAPELGRRVCSVALAPDGRTLAASSSGKVVLWDLEKGKPLRSLLGVRNRHTIPTSLHFSPDGRLVAAAVGSAVSLWETASGALLAPAPAEAASGIHAVRLSADGRLLAAADEDGTVGLWDIPARRVRHRLYTHAWGGSHIVLSADGTALAATSSDERILVWDTATGRQRHTVPAGPEKDSQPRCLAFSPDGGVLAASYFSTRQTGGARGVRLWDLAAGKERQDLRVKDAVHSWFVALAFSGDGRRLTGTTVDGLTYRWDSTGGRFGEPEVVCRDHGFGAVAYSPAGWLAASNPGSPGLALWELKTGKPALALPGPDGFGRALGFSPDGRYLASGANLLQGGDPKEVRDHTLRLYELASGQEVLRRELAAHTGVTSLVFGADSRALLTGMSDSTVLVWEVFPAGAAGEKRLPQLWDDLGHTDAAKAHRAAGALLAEGDRAVTFLAERLKPAAAPDPARLARLVADLHSDKFEVREAATRELAKVAEAARPALERACATASPEARRRITRLLEGSGSPLLSGEAIRAVRAITVLEHVNTPTARALLRRLSAGAPEARLTAEAKAALRRLPLGR